MLRRIQKNVILIQLMQIAELGPKIKKVLILSGLSIPGTFKTLQKFHTSYREEPAKKLHNE